MNSKEAFDKSVPTILVDFDGTLAEYHGWVGPDELGKPVPKMVERVKEWLRNPNLRVKIFTARAFPLETMYQDLPEYAERVEEAIRACTAIQTWCKDVFGQIIPITCIKDFSAISIYDDRAVQIVKNTGEIVGDQS